MTFGRSGMFPTFGCGQFTKQWLGTVGESRFDIIDGLEDELRRICPPQTQLGRPVSDRLVRRCGHFERRSLIKHCMEVGPTETEGAHTCTPRCFTCPLDPRPRFGIQIEWTGRKV